MKINENLKKITNSIDHHSVVDNVTFVAVTKSVDLSSTIEVLDSGIKHIGENRLKSIDEKYSYISEYYPETKWHFIGHIQKNKAKKIVSVSDYIHSIDSFALLEIIDKCCGDQKKRVKVFLEVNISGEKQKYGFAKKELLENIDDLVKYKNIDTIGLMTMAPYQADEIVLTSVFGGLRELRDELNVKGLSSIKELSMGMSIDYQTALREGATFLRIGSSIFE